MGELCRTDICRIAELTRGQRQNALWHELRQCRLTGSKFGEIAKAARCAQPDYDKIRSELFTPKDLSGIPAIQWGEQNEVNAINGYIAKSGYNIKDTGLWLFPNACIGASPDGLVFIDDTLAGILEVKCPYCIRSKLNADKFLDLPYIMCDSSFIKISPLLPSSTG